MGSLVVTANTYLAQAGPVGSVIGLVLGAIIMLVVCQNYAYMMSCYPDAGGVYSFCRECFGYDHGFLAAWFLMLTYLAMLWANATSLPLFARYFLGDIFRFGRMYELFGYGVYLGEALLSVAFILAAAFLCARSNLAVSVAAATLLYVFVTLLSVTAYPPEYGSWLEYIRDLDHLSGTKALPAFYAAEYYLGGAGIWILMASLLALILTSLIGNITALSRLFYALGRDGVLPSSLGELNRHGVPGKAIGLIALVSALVPFLGRTAIG